MLILQVNGNFVIGKKYRSDYRKETTQEKVHKMFAKYTLFYHIIISCMFMIIVHVLYHLCGSQFCPRYYM